MTKVIKIKDGLGTLKCVFKPREITKHCIHYSV